MADFEARQGYRKRPPLKLQGRVAASAENSEGIVESRGVVGEDVTGSRGRFAFIPLLPVCFNDNQK